MKNEECAMTHIQINGIYKQIENINKNNHKKHSEAHTQKQNWCTNENNNKKHKKQKSNMYFKHHLAM